MLILSMSVIMTMLISAFLTTTSVNSGVIAVEHKSLKNQVSSLAKIVAVTPQFKETLYASRWQDDNSGYAFLANGTTGRYIVYPPKPAKEGTKMRHIKLIEGGTLEQAIIRTSQLGKPEMVHYLHDKLGANKKTLKATFLYPIKQGGPVLIAGEYLDSADALLNNIYKKIFTPMALVAMLVLTFVSIITRHINCRATYLSKAMKRLADGDLRKDITLSGSDEMAFLANVLNITQTSLKQILKQQADNGTSIATASLQIDSNLNHTNKLIKSELDNLDQLASAMEEMVCSVAEVAENANNASENAQSTNQRTQQGEKQIQQCIEEIELLCSNLKNCIHAVSEVKDGVISINSLVDTIHGISGQTNLLALNAAIEAARAGEHGRGFAVVADEVRLLASRTQAATQEITDTIAKLNTQALSAVSLVDESANTAETGMNAAKSAGDEFVAITKNVSSLNDSNLQIATAAEQQRNVALTMSQNINRLNSELAETSQDLSELASASNSLNEQTNNSEKQLSVFNFEQDNQEQKQQDNPAIASSHTMANELG